jgi:hypothetical protein
MWPRWIAIAAFGGGTFPSGFAPVFNGFSGVPPLSVARSPPVMPLMT